MPSPGYRISGKEVEICDSGSRHHQLCGCCNLQLIQSHVAPSHGPPARVRSPLFFLAKSLLLPKSRGKKKHSKTSWSSLLSFRTAWSFFSTSEPHGPLSIYLLQNLMVHSFLQGRMVSSFLPQNLLVLPTTLEPRGLFFLWLPGLGLNPSAHLPLQPHF